MATESPRFALVAGEASGDLLAGLLLDGLKARWPQLSSWGIGGPQMARRGFEVLWPSDKLAVRGYVEVLRHYREIVGIRDQLRDKLMTWPPAAFIGVDAPDFNLSLEADLKAQGIPTVHFVCPSIWAWRPERIAQIRDACDHVLCIFPFEPDLLAREGIAATYVGHPLANVIPAQPDPGAARAALRLRDVDGGSGPIVALLPGSRASEIDYLLDRFLAAAKVMAKARPELRFVLPAVPAQRARIMAKAERTGLGDRLLVTAGQSHTVLAACDVVLVASGTATLEAALYQRPMVIAYNMHWLSWQMMKRKKLQPWVGLPNILCNDFVVPELLQGQATPEALARETLAWLDDPGRMAAVRRRFAELHTLLQRDTASLAAHAIEKVLQA